MATSDVKVWDGTEWVSMIGPVGPQGETGPQGEQGPQGEPGADGKDGSGVHILGELDDPSQLPTTGEPGDAYLIKGDLWVWDDKNARWVNVGRIQGPQGETGPAGPEGEPGPQGDPGPGNSLSIGSVTKGAYADATITGESPNQVLNLTLPQGDTGSAATVTVGSTQTLIPGSDATVTNSGTIYDAVLEFGIPTGAEGPPGPKGDPGDDGDEGPVGPQGPQGDPGKDGDPGPEGPPGPKGDPGRGVHILGELDDPSQLPTDGDPGDAYLIKGDLWVWDETNSKWIDVGKIQGPEGPQGPKGDPGDDGSQGPVGPQGPAGDPGKDGDPGPAGPPNVLSIGVVVKGDEAAASITGTSPDQTLNLTLPKGDPGERGVQGDVGPTGPEGPKGPPGDKGEPGDKGDPGEKGATGNKGDAATITVGVTETLAPGSKAYVKNVGSTSAAVFDFGIPKGEAGGGAGGDTPVGAIMPYVGSTAPDGWLMCDGSVVDAGKYPALAKMLAAFGGKTPNLKDRFPLGAGAAAVGATGGATSISKVVAHTHTVTGQVAVADTDLGNKVLQGASATATPTGSAHTHGAGSLVATTNLAGNHDHGIPWAAKSTNTQTGGSNQRITDNGSQDYRTNLVNSHQHQVNAGQGQGSWSGSTTAPVNDAHTHTIDFSKATVPLGKHGHTGTLTGAQAATTGDPTVSIMNPYLALNYIIKAA